MTTHVDNYLLPKKLKLTAKYTEKDFERIREMYKSGVGIREITRQMTPMSRRMVQFTIFPERKELAKKNFAKRQKDGRYKYSTHVQTGMVRAVRNRKKKILSELIKK